MGSGYPSLWQRSSRSLLHPHASSRLGKDTATEKDTSIPKIGCWLASKASLGKAAPAVSAEQDNEQNYQQHHDDRHRNLHKYRKACDTAFWITV